MKIVIIGSIKFYPEYLKIKQELEEKGHKVIIPLPNEFYHGEPDIKRKTMEEFNQYILKCDAVIIANFEKDGKKNYIGTNSLMEIGIAFNRKKKIFVLNQIPDSCRIELEAIGAVELNRDLGKIS